MYIDIVYIYPYIPLNTSISLSLSSLCIHVYTCVYMCIHVYTCVYMCIHVYTCVYMCIHTYVRTYVRAYVRTSMHAIFI